MLGDDIVNDLTNKIQSNELPQGSKLKSERILAEEYGVSRTIMREALKTMSNRGYLRIMPGKGAYVQHPGSQVLTDNLEMLYETDSYSMAELIEVREELEVAFTRIAAQRATDQQLEELERKYHAINNSARDFASFMHLDKEFHHYLYALSGNSAMSVIADGLYNTVDKSWYLPLQMFPEHIPEAQKQHIAIIEALKSRDADQVEKALRQHLYVLHRELEKQPIADEDSAPEA